MIKLMKHPSWCLSGTIRFEMNPVFDSFFSCVRFSSPCTFSISYMLPRQREWSFFHFQHGLFFWSCQRPNACVASKTTVDSNFCSWKEAYAIGWHSRLFAVTLLEGEIGGVSCWDLWLRCALRRSAILVEPLEAGTGRGLPNSMLLLEIAIAASSTAHRFGAVLVRSLVKVRSSPNAESRLFARYYMVARVNACYVACSIQDLRSRVILPAPKLDITSMPNFVGPFCCIKAYFLQVLL